VTPEKIAEAAQSLHQLLKAQHPDVVPTRLDPTIPRCELSKKRRIAHTLWLLEAVPKLLDEDRREKAMRWLCWCQGMAWESDLVSTIAELKDANRPDESKVDGLGWPRA
jgi:hypothetical protein